MVPTIQIWNYLNTNLQNKQYSNWFWIWMFIKRDSNAITFVDFSSSNLRSNWSQSEIKIRACERKFKTVGIWILDTVQVVSIGLFWLYFMPFSYSGVYFLWFIFNRTLAQYERAHSFWKTFSSARSKSLWFIWTISNWISSNVSKTGSLCIQNLNGTWV